MNAHYFLTSKFVWIEVFWIRQLPNLNWKFGRACIIFESLLSPGQTDWQVVASGRKLNLRRDLRWVAKRTRKFPRKYTQVAKKDILRQTILYFIG